MRNILKKITYFGMATASLALLSGPAVHASQKSENEKSFSSHNFTKNNAWQQRLAKDGYSFRLNKNSDGGVWKNIAGTNNQRIAKSNLRNTNFKIDKIWSYKNGMSYKVSNKNGKYTGWVDAVFIYNKNRTNNQLKPIIKAEQKVVDNTDNKIYSENYKTHSLYNKNAQKILNKANKKANKLSGNNKKIALESINQTKIYAQKGNGYYSELPSLLWWT